MPLQKPLAAHTLRELLESVQDDVVRDAAQILGAAAKTFGLPVVFSTAPGSDVADRAARLLGITTSAWSATVRAGRGFIGGQTRSPAAGQRISHQLFCPATVRVLVRAIVASSPIASDVWLVRHDVALGNLDGEAANLQLASAAPVAQVRWQSTLATPGTVIAKTHVPAAVPVTLLAGDGWTFEISGDRGLVVGTNQADQASTVTFFWEETPA